MCERGQHVIQRVDYQVNILRLLQIAGFSAAAILFVRATFIIYRIRDKYGWHHARELGPGHHDAAHKAELRRFFAYLAVATAIVVALALMSLLSANAATSSSS